MTEIVTDPAGEFFAPANTDMMDGLISQYQRDRHRIAQVCEFVKPERLGSVIHYFIEGNQDRRDRFTGSVERLFAEEGAVAALNAHYWQRALNLTDVLDFMPTKRREEWFELIQRRETPEFEDATVRATLAELLRQRMDFLAEKVDGIFRSLSHTHVTNQPEGFGKRMILTGVTNDWGAYGRTKTGHINDLRQVIAKFMSRDEPGWNASNRMVEIARREHRGEWLDVDGGALRIRCYKNGNAHLEVHPDIAWRLNQILAHLHPMAIPSRFRTPPKKKARAFTLMERPLPFAVLDLLAAMRPVETSTVRASMSGRVIKPQTTNPNSLKFEFADRDKTAIAEAEKVLGALGGVKCSNDTFSWFEFDYPPKEIVNQIVVSGCIPDAKSHQFYPTPSGLAAQAVELAEIGEGDQCLEPSAGTGGIADHLPQGRTLCVEISRLHCDVLEAKGYEAVEADFLEWAEDPAMPAPDGTVALDTRFDAIVMNPPFSQGRAAAHVQAAAGLLAPTGRLVAILPASFRGRTDLLPDMAVTWTEPFNNEFAGTGVSVVMMRATHSK